MKIDSSPERGDDDGLEPWVAKLEQFVDECQKDLRSLDVRLTRVETLTEGITKNMATKADISQLKADISQLETSLIKWFVGTAIAVAGLAFAAAKYFH
jgi:hypothetical protein